MPTGLGNFPDGHLQNLATDRKKRSVGNMLLHPRQPKPGLKADEPRCIFYSYFRRRERRPRRTASVPPNPQRRPPPLVWQPGGEWRLTRRGKSGCWSTRRRWRPSRRSPTPSTTSTIYREFGCCDCECELGYTGAPCKVKVTFWLTLYQGYIAVQ